MLVDFGWVNEIEDCAVILISFDCNASGILCLMQMNLFTGRIWKSGFTEIITIIFGPANISDVYLKHDWQYWCNFQIHNMNIIILWLFVLQPPELTSVPYQTTVCFL